MAKKEEFPEAEKWSKRFSDARLLEEFLDWINSQGISLCEPSVATTKGFYVPILRTRMDLFYGFFGIDAKKLDDERREMLRRMRESED